MKKFLAFAAVVLLAFSAKAEDLYAGGSLSFWRNSTDKQTTISILPEIGIHLDSKWALGTTIGYTHTETGSDDNKYITNAFLIGPYARYTYFTYEKVSLFCDGGFNISTGKGRFHGESGDAMTAWSIGFKPGVAFNVNKKFGVVAHFGFLGYEGVNDGAKEAGYKEGFGLRFSGDAMSLGFYYNF